MRFFVYNNIMKIVIIVLSVIIFALLGVVLFVPAGTR